MPTLLKTPIVIVILVILGAVLWHVFGNHSETPTSGTETSAVQAQVRSTVTSFGSQLQKVSLLAPNASTTIAQTYGPYAASDLLTQWEQNPSVAPGRQTSSPWPDHIDITNVTASDSGTFTVTGTLVFMTSNEVEHGGNAGTEPVTLTVKNSDGTWRIIAYQQGTGHY